jgi:hypothetical protein
MLGFVGFRALKSAHRSNSPDNTANSSGQPLLTYEVHPPEEGLSPRLVRAKLKAKPEPA